MATTFAAQVRFWTDMTQRRAEAIFRQSAQDVLAEAQRPVGDGGNMPVDTGFLRRSLTTEIVGGARQQGADGYVFVITGAELGDVIEARWTASYAKYVHDGARGRAGRPWITLAAMSWERIVRENAARAEALSK